MKLLIPNREIGFGYSETILSELISSSEGQLVTVTLLDNSESPIELEQDTAYLYWVIGSIEVSIYIVSDSPPGNASGIKILLRYKLI